MKTNALAPNSKGFRFPPEIISHAVWLSVRFSLSFRDVEEPLAQRGIVVSSERLCCKKEEEDDKPGFLLQIVRNHQDGYTHPFSRASL